MKTQIIFRFSRYLVLLALLGCESQEAEGVRESLAQPIGPQAEENVTGSYEYRYVYKYVPDGQGRMKWDHVWEYGWVEK